MCISRPTAPSPTKATTAAGTGARARRAPSPFGGGASPDNGATGRWHVPTCSQGPFPVRGKLAYLMGVPAREIHVFTERVGGGFGGKQEMVSEDLPLFASMKLDGRPVKWEWTRKDEVLGAPPGLN